MGKHRTMEKVGMHRPANRSSESSGIYSLLMLVMLIAAGIACCMWMSPRLQQKDGSVVQGQPVGSVPGGTVIGHPMGGTGGSYPHMGGGVGGFGSAALAGGTGLVGGMMLGS